MTIDSLLDRASSDGTEELQLRVLALKVPLSLKL